MTIRTWRLLVAGFVCGIAGCVSVAPEPPRALSADREGVVTGTVTYRERIALPPDAIVEVWMIDVSPGMLVLALIAETAVPTQGRQAPIRFELRYDRSRVLPDHSYAVKAAIRSQGRMLFASDDGQPVVFRGSPHEVVLWLKRVTEAPAGDASRL